MPELLKILPASSLPFLSVTCFVAIMAAYLVLLTRGDSALPPAKRPLRAAAAITGVFLIIYGLYAWSVGFPRSAWIPPVYVAGATLLSLRARGRKGIGLADALFILWVWLPIDTRWLQKGWPWPEGMQALLVIPFATTLVVLLARKVRGWEGMKFRLALGRGDVVITLKYLVGFLALAIPFGLLTGFLTVRDNPVDLTRLGLSFVGLFLFVAVPEEMLFRGLLMTALAKRWQRPTLALVVSAVIFGLAHLNNGDAPDWRFAALAALAGVFYGKAFTAGRSFSPAVIIHTLVDVIWINFFS